mmetsp:Transcript_27326/g.76306  ORF Transcript_27326/g.76306 Transcript_27326/m.76306 type:complete len:377 (+) Transcript_27326:172-1302(+)|eukprot:CAMPEP_0119128336 /NCGR_PEP_ID=MMETSP1310-20130426/6537_1 /TAXON_ID=464262 /ORGANISM="Genus nov. species nov., Strain RCC2339" /LENGTH=376 /DNA_ID=CAMNT_0007118669 /DNA_START=169 /DNA_END=1299 /DNA_ORIENTATION=-
MAILPDNISFPGLEPYQGFDINLSEDPHCFACSCRYARTPRGSHGGEASDDDRWDNTAEEIAAAKRLLKCSRCRVAVYCSARCQREDYKGEHREACKALKEYSDEMKREELRLHHAPATLSYDNMNYFKEDNIGHFYGLFETRGYLRAIYGLAEEIRYLAHTQETRPLWDKVVKLHLEILRLNHSDNMGVRFKLPFYLLSLNRDQDCYSFIKHWKRVYDRNDGKPPSPPPRKGEWFYPRDANVLEPLPGGLIKELEGSLAWAAAVLVVKLRKIGALETAVRLGKVASDPEVLPPLVADAHRLLNMIERRNPVFLKALVNPGPLRSQDMPEYWSPGKPSEAYMVLNDCCRHFHRIPFAIQRIEAMVGVNPSYDFTMD